MLQKFLKEFLTVACLSIVQAELLRLNWYEMLSTCHIITKMYLSLQQLYDMCAFLLDELFLELEV